MNMNSLNEEYLQIDAGKTLAQLTRKKRDRLLREHDILRAAEHVFATQGYYKTTIQDIAKEAEYATGTIYLYFKDKEALYLVLLEKKIQHLISYIKEKVGVAQEVNEKIRVLVYEHLSYFQENQDFFRIYFSERDGMRWTIKDKLPASAINKFLQYIDFVASIIQKAQDENILKKDFDSKQLAHVLSSIVNTVILSWLHKEHNKKEDLMDASAFVLDIFLNGAGRKR